MLPSHASVFQRPENKPLGEAAKESTHRLVVVVRRLPFRPQLIRAVEGDKPISQGIMDSRLSFLLLMLVVSFISANARSSATLGVFAVEVDNEVQSESNTGRNEKLCTLCEEYASQAINYLSENETQTQIISRLHESCSQLHSFKRQCISLVDYYVPILFVEISTISPEQLCEKVNLCEEAVLVNLPKHDDACTLCHNIVAEILTKLQDPDRQLEVIEILLKGCNKMGNYAKKCKKMVLEYGPLILINAENFLQKNDVCAAIRACQDSEGDLTGSVLADA
ncbi:hypothetical protein OPV22_030804 [Ensete ventricosum]|uniref:Pulmonary surfactant-associated protein B n=1 Tax=Ensete ventricosum TaxID=4639 RepID=A0AAV8PTK9_ENSVE|nr:hypothetical protein OPV22_030804 [Ensete ventricosum]